MLTFMTFLFVQDPEPKDTLKLTEINAVFAEDKTKKDTSLQICYVRDGRRRNLFVYSETGQVKGQLECDNCYSMVYCWSSSPL